MKKYEQLQKAFDTSANGSPLIHLSSQEASDFVDLIVDKSVLLNKVRVVKMDRAKLNIGRILSGGRFLQPGGQDVAVADDKTYKAKTDTITLITKEFIGKIEIHDDEIRHSVNGEGIENTLLGHAAKKIRNELEELILYSDTTGTFVTGLESFKVVDGVFKRLKGKSGEVDFSVGFANQFADNEKFRKMLKTMPVEYRNGAEFFLNNDVMIDYTANFDNSVNRDAFVDNILSKPANEVPLASFDSKGETQVLFTNPQNIIWGVQIEDMSMQFERERVASKRKTVFHFSIEMDFNVEIPEAAVVGNKMKTK